MDRIGPSNPIFEQINNNTDSSNKTDSPQDAFLRLLTTQLENQDPMEPMQSGEFLSQIAQFTTATGITELNTSFTGLSGALTSNMALQATSLVGRDVLMQSDTAALNDGQNVNGILDLPQSTTELKLFVYDAAGQLVRTQSMGMQAKGKVPFEWNGSNDQGVRLPSGQYTISAQAMVEGKPESVAASLYATVESVTMNSGGTGVTLNVEGLGPRKLADVEQLK